MTERDEFHIDKNSVEAMLEWLYEQGQAASVTSMIEGGWSFALIQNVRHVEISAQMSGMNLIEGVRWMVDQYMRLRDGKAAADA